MRINTRVALRDVVFVVILALFATVAVVLPAPRATANHEGAGLNARPETETRPVGSVHTITAQLVTACASDTECVEAPRTPTSGAVIINFENEGGPNDPDNGASLTTPDRQCGISGAQFECSITYTGTNRGTDVWRVWIDHTAPDTTEGRNEATSPGNAGCGAPPNTEPDCTDVVEVTWGAGPPATLDCDDQSGPDTERELNPSGGPDSNEVYTCFARDQFGNPVADADPEASGTQNIIVRGEVENDINDPDATDGPSHTSPDYNCTISQGPTATAPNNPPFGQCNITVTQNELELGTAEICFWIGAASEGAGLCADEPTGENQQANLSDTGNDLADQVEKTWSAAAATLSGLDAEPETDRNEPGQIHTLTGTVFDQFGRRFNGNTEIKFEFFQGSPSDRDGNTPASPDLSCTTQSSSSCSVTYTSNSAGTDLVCVWFGAAPTPMSGTNANGTCDGEGLTEADDDPNSADAPEPRNDRVDVVQAQWGGEGQGIASRLDCSPETQANQTGTSHTVTCTATDAQGGRVTGANIDAEATGANDSDGNTPTVPDFSCTTVGDNPQTPANEGGTCSFTHGGTGQSTSATGVTTYRAWLDTDNTDGTTEADATEGRDETATPGATAEPDGTDVVEKTWTTATRLDCAPETDRNPAGTTHTVTCTATDAQNVRVGGVLVDAEATGDNDPDNGDTPRSPDFTCTTGGDDPQTQANEAGTCSFTHGGTGQSTASVGLTTYRAWIDADNNNNTTEADATEGRDETATPGGTAEVDTTDVVEKTWTEGPEARTIDCSPESSRNPTGTEHEVTCTVRDTANLPVEGVSVTFTESGPGTFVGDTVKTTDNTGRVRATTTSDERGAQTITGTITESTEKEPDVDECDRAANDPQGAPAGVCSDSVTKNWGSEAKGACARSGAILGTDGDDVLVGTNGDDIICGFGGKDTLRGLGGDDILIGHSGDDTLEGGDGSDTMRGGGKGDVLEGGAGKDILRGGRGSDTLKGNKGHDFLRGGRGADTLRGGRGNDTLSGGRGNDFCRGGSGRDVLRSCER